MIVDCALYEDGSRVPSGTGISVLDQLDAHPEGFVWLGLRMPDIDELTGMCRRLDIDGIDVDEVLSPHTRPVLSVEGDVLNLVVRTARYIDAEETVSLGEMTILVHDRAFVSVRHGQASPLSELREELEQSHDRLRHGPLGVMVAIVARIIADYRPALDGFEKDALEVEREVFAVNRQQPVRRLYALKREVRVLLLAIESLDEPLDRLIRHLSRHADRAVVEDLNEAADQLARTVSRVNSLSGPPRRGADGESRPDRHPAERGHAQDQRLGGDGGGAHDGRRHLRHELRAHARAGQRLGVSRSCSQGWARSSSSCTGRSSRTTGSDRPGSGRALRFAHMRRLLAVVTVALVPATLATHPVSASPAAPSERLCFDVSGAPGDVALVNLTPVSATAPGNGQLISSDVATPPEASNVNFGPGTIDPNVAAAKVGTDGRVCFVNSVHGSVHVIADDLGSLSSTAFTPAGGGAPLRRVDTRTGLGGDVLDPSERLCFTVNGQAGDVAMVNLTPVSAQRAGFGVLLPDDSTIATPTTSNVNFGPGSVDPNVALATVGASGKVCFVNSVHGAVHLVADELGTIARAVAKPAATGGIPKRVVDTRLGVGGGMVAPSGRLCFAVAGSPGDLALVNLTPVDATRAGYGQLVSSDVTTPADASNVNFSTRTFDPNVAAAVIGADGQVCFVNSVHAAVHLVADHLISVAGSAYTPPSPSGALLRVIDTRPVGSLVTRDSALLPTRIDCLTSEACVVAVGNSPVQSLTITGNGSTVTLGAAPTPATVPGARAVAGMRTRRQVLRGGHVRRSGGVAPRDHQPRRHLGRGRTASDDRRAQRHHLRLVDPLPGGRVRRVWRSGRGRAVRDARTGAPRGARWRCPTMSPRSSRSTARPAPSASCSRRTERPRRVRTLTDPPIDERRRHVDHRVGADRSPVRVDVPDGDDLSRVQ